MPLSALQVFVFVLAATAASCQQCTTRAECNSTCICSDIEMESLWLVKNKSGVCASCSSFGNTTCPSPCGVQADGCVAGTLAMRLDLDLGPPYYFQVESAIAKPVFTVLLFGANPYSTVPESVAKFNAKRVLQLAFSGMALHTFVQDMQKAHHAAAEATDWWTAYIMVIVVLATSSNLASCFSATSLWMANEITTDWLKAHSDGAPLPPMQIDIVKDVYLQSFVIYCGCLMLLGIPLALRSLVYFWVWLAYALAEFGLINLLLDHGIPFLVQIKGRSHHQEVRLLDVDVEDVSEMRERLFQFNPAYKFTGSLGDDAKVKERYNREAKYFEDTGMTHQSWQQFCGMAFMSPLFTFLAPVVARHIMTGEYWTPLVTTISERHLAIYISHSVAGIGPLATLVWWLV